MPRARSQRVSTLDDMLNRDLKTRALNAKDASRSAHDSHMGKIKNVLAHTADELAPDAGDLSNGTYWVIDPQTGEVRGYLTATPRPEFPGYHLAFFDTDGKFQFGVSADNGSAVFAAGLARVDEDGASFDNNEVGMFFESGDDLTNVFGRLDAASVFKLDLSQLGSADILNTNGTFETGDFTNWTETDSGGVVGISTDAHRGNYACAWTGDGSATDGLINFSSGSTLYYLVTFYAKLSVLASNKKVYIQDAGGAGSIHENLIVSTEWNKYYAVTDRRASSLDIWADDGIIIDDVEIYNWLYGSSIEMDGNDILLSAESNIYSAGSITLRSDQVFVEQRLSDDSLRETYLPALGFQPYAFQIGGSQGLNFALATTSLAANGGALAIPILLNAPMLLESVTIQANDTSGARTWTWWLYAQYINDESVSTPVELNSFGAAFAKSFTPSAAGIRTIDADNAPVYLPPGMYWLVIQNQHATNTFALGSVAGLTNMGYTCLQNTLTNPVNSPIDLQLALWNKVNVVAGVRLNGLVDHAFLVADVPMSGEDGSTIFTDNEGNTWTANGNAQIDTSLGSAYGLFDGTGDTLSTPDSIRWRLDDGLNYTKWRVSVDVCFNGDPGTAMQGFLQQRVDDSNFWSIRLQNNLLDLLIRSGGVNIVNITATWNPATATTYNIAVVKDGVNGYSLYVDDAQVGSTTENTNVMPDFAASLVFGDLFFSGLHNYFNGWARNLKIKKGTIA